MRYFCLIFLLYASSLPGLSQDFTICGHQGNSIFIGLHNILEVQPVDGMMITAIKGPCISAHRVGKHTFSVSTSCVRDQIWIKLISEGIEVDSIKIKSERLHFNQFVQTENFGLVTPGTYPKKVLQDFKSMFIQFNAHWIETPIFSFEINIYQNGEVLCYNLHQEQTRSKMDSENQKISYYSLHPEGSLNNPNLKKAIANLKKGDVIVIENIKASFPYSCGAMPQAMRFECK